MIKKLIPFTAAFLLVFCVDQLTKWWARGEGIVIYNEGFSFGISLFEQPLFFCLISVIVLVFLFFSFKDIWMKHLYIYGSLSGAALSNVSDRFFFPGVQDFLPLPFLQLKNNIADWVIFLCLLWVVGTLFTTRDSQTEGD